MRVPGRREPGVTLRTSPLSSSRLMYRLPNPWQPATFTTHGVPSGRVPSSIPGIRYATSLTPVQGTEKRRKRQKENFSQGMHTQLTHTQSRILYNHFSVTVPPNCVCLHEMRVNVLPAVSVRQPTHTFHVSTHSFRARPGRRGFREFWIACECQLCTHFTSEKWLCFPSSYNSLFYGSRAHRAHYLHVGPSASQLLPTLARERLSFARVRLIKHFFLSHCTPKLHVRGTIYRTKQLCIRNMGARTRRYNIAASSRRVPGYRCIIYFRLNGREQHTHTHSLSCSLFFSLSHFHALFFFWSNYILLPLFLSCSILLLLSFQQEWRT